MPELSDIFNEETSQETENEAAVEPAEEPVVEPAEEPTEPTEEIEASEETVNEPNEEVPSQEQQPVEQVSEQPDQDLKYLRDIVFSDDELFQQVMRKARQLSGEEVPEQVQETLQPPEYPEDDTDPEEMRKYFKSLTEYNQKQTQAAIQQALAQERQRSLEEQQRMKAEMERANAFNAVKTEFKLEDSQMNEFLQWAKNPANGNMSEYMKTLYRVYQEMNNPKQQSKVSRLNQAANSNKGAAISVNAANIGGGNEAPSNPNDEFNEAFMNAYKRNKKVF